jgi:Rnl2 family RNA ligase
MERIMTENVLEFNRYPSIENSYRGKFLDKINFTVPPDVIWAASEKVHGANFSFITNGEEVIVGKRSGLIKWDEPFYNHNVILNKYKEGILSLFKNLNESVEECKQIQVFGEIFGGNSRDNIRSKFSSVQGGVFYTPDIEFVGFDVLINNDHFLPLKFVNSFLEVSGGIPTPPLLVKGSLEECLSFSPVFTSKVALSFGYDFEGNFAEGVVIRPFENEYRLPNGSRIILKNKNETFNEAEPKERKEQAPRENQGELDYHLNEMKDRYITRNRFDSVISKVGNQLTMKDFGKVFGLLIHDIITDYIKDNDLEIMNEDVKYMKGCLSPFIQVFVKENIQEFLI